MTKRNWSSGGRSGNNDSKRSSKQTRRQQQEKMINIILILTIITISATMTMGQNSLGSSMRGQIPHITAGNRSTNTSTSINNDRNRKRHPPTNLSLTSSSSSSSRIDHLHSNMSTDGSSLNLKRLSKSNGPTSTRRPTSHPATCTKQGRATGITSSSPWLCHRQATG
mmetsp:Transcript_66283/g.143838  ORF Transcript_66283/g.143838 Transcript_66283/m.143838 type:complete len:167 (-) Transcript_66283:134-634(-)